MAAQVLVGVCGCVCMCVCARVRACMYVLMRKCLYETESLCDWDPGHAGFVNYEQAEDGDAR